MNEAEIGNVAPQMKDSTSDDNKPDTLPEREISTKQLDTGKFNPELRAELEKIGNTYRSTERKLVLFFPTDSDPLILEMTGTITIGRPDFRAGMHPTIDLTPYHGAQLGVSRFHAQITLVNGHFHLKDMGSTNGTRINNQKIPPYRLMPFKSGDNLRFGHLNV
ncbi:MAG: FHA domain-containing protein, partial [Chloroflexota bacterium]